MNWLNILGTYLIISVLVFLFSAIPVSINKCEPFSWKAIFIFQYALYTYMKDELNLLGIVILETIVTILTFGSSVILAIMIAITWILLSSWKLFYFIFKKR